MKLDVYPTDAEAFEAAAALVAERLNGADAGPAVALSGGRGGRGVMLALAARTDLPWERIEWFWCDERCVPPGDLLSNVRLARESLLGPRAVAEARIHPPSLELGDPERIAAAYADTLVACLGQTPAFEVMLLGVGKNGHVASLMPGAAALRATSPVAAVAREEVSEDPLVARITVTPPVLFAARHVVVTVTGPEKAGPIATALRGPADPGGVPAQLVRPGTHVSWIVDRAAAAKLLRDARPASDA
jgi:6-phosphogluconolactonase